MQHRGQDAAGIATADGERLHLVKHTGLVGTALAAERVAPVAGRLGIGHVRYPTIGGVGAEEAQPYLTRLHGLALAHNGNLTHTRALEAELGARGLRPMSRNDGELLLLLLADELTRRGGAGGVDVAVDAVAGLMRRARGAYAAVAIAPVDGAPAVIGFRDPRGLRPLCHGLREDGAQMVASESVALDALGFRLVGEVPPGGAVILRPGQPAEVRTLVPEAPAPCAFEHVYFARADAILDGRRVNATRWALGERLADAWSARGLAADVIVGVPDTSRPAVMAMSERLGIPHREGFIKNRYSGRTFILPDTHAREAALRLKLNPIAEAFAGQRVLLVDDSIVRGSTMARIAAMVRDLGPREVHVGVFSPPVRHPCYFGIDMPTRAELVANDAPPEGLEALLRARFGVDSVTFTSAEDLRAVTGASCQACFDGAYPLPVDEGEAAWIGSQRRPTPSPNPPRPE
jgi:amidophosphoribosyltransferase